ncbi:MAG: dihydroorotase [Bacteroidota bacterium]
MKIILKDVKIYGSENPMDILITDGIISKLGGMSKDDQKDAQVFELSGRYAVPGLIDMHVHLREPGREDEETVLTGCNSAAAGGFTAVASMPNTEPAADSSEIVRFIKERASAHLVDVYPVGAVSVGRKGESLAPMAELCEAGAVAFSDDGTAVKSARLMRYALEYSGMYGIPVIEHAEEESLAGGSMNEGVTSTYLGLPPVPSIAEDLIVMRDILLAEYTGGRIHIAHVSTKNAVEMIRQARKKGIKVTAEVTPHHFTLSEESVKGYDTNMKMNPPLRTREDVEAMIAGLADGTIDVIASDHAPHSIEEKEMEFQDAPNGIVGLETSLGLALSELVHKKHITLAQLVEKMSINPRKILNIPVPVIAPGEPANITIIDPDIIWTVDVKKFRSKCKNSPFDKRLLTGKSVAVINRNQMFVEDKFIKI